MADDIMTLQHRSRGAALVLVMIAGALGAGGCDALPWFSEGEEQGQALGAADATTTAPTVLPNDILATVNDVHISNEDMKLRIEELKMITANFGQEWTPLTTEQLENVLEELINTELMNQQTVARGLHRSLDTQQRWAFMERAFFAQEWLRWAQERQEVSAEEIEAYYELNKLGFREPERLKLRQIVTSSESQAKQALTGLLGETVEFAALAQQISVGPTAAQKGELAGWVMRANAKALLFASEADAEAAGLISLDPVLEGAAFAIDKPNGFSNYVKGPDGNYHLFQLVERQEATQRPLTEVWDAVKNFLLVQRLQQTIEELKEEARLERFVERLEDIEQ